MPGMAVCCRNASRYGSSTGMMPKGVNTGCCPVIPVLQSTTTSAARPISLRMSADQRESRERTDIVTAPRPDKAGVARCSVRADPNVILAIALEVNAAEERQSIELVGQPPPRDFFAVSRVRPLDAVIERAREQVASRQVVVSNRRSHDRAR